MAAFALALPLGSVLGMNFVAMFMFGCVVFVAVTMWTEAKIARYRREAAPEPETPVVTEDAPRE